MWAIVIGLAVLLGTCGFAWWKGGPAERGGVAVYVGSWMVVTFYEVALGQSFPVLPILLLDALIALSFLALALRYNSLWLGAAMILQGLSLGLHATHLTEIEDARIFGLNAYALSINVISVAILGVFISGAMTTMRQRRREGEEVSEAMPEGIAALP